MMNEQCWVLLGGMQNDLWCGEKVQPFEGSPASVAFNPDYVTKRDDEHHDVVGFIHTHPTFTAHYSMRDDRTMRAWVLSLGKPLVCCIIGTDGLRAWWYLNDEDEPFELQAQALRNIVFGLTPEELAYEKEDPREHFVICPEDEEGFLESLCNEGAGDRPDAAESDVEPNCESNQG